MGDMLIRGIDAELKRRLEDSARQSGRSLSEEAIALMQKGFAISEVKVGKAGDRLYSLVGNAYFNDEELDMLKRSRKESDREPPRFE